MGRECAITGKKTSLGNQKTYRGKAKYLGGVGRKITGTTRRTFKPNLQRIRVQVGDKVERLWVSVSAIRSGLVQKPVKREPFQLPTF
jgi:large subunit ribosomal protein L28